MILLVLMLLITSVVLEVLLLFIS